MKLRVNINEALEGGYIPLDILKVSHIFKKKWASIHKIRPTSESFVSPYPEKYFEFFTKVSPVPLSVWPILL